MLSVKKLFAAYKTILELFLILFFSKLSFAHTHASTRSTMNKWMVSAYEIKVLPLSSRSIIPPQIFTPRVASSIQFHFMSREGCLPSFRCCTINNRIWLNLLRKRKKESWKRSDGWGRDERWEIWFRDERDRDLWKSLCVVSDGWGGGGPRRSEKLSLVVHTAGKRALAEAKLIRLVHEESGNRDNKLEQCTTTPTTLHANEKSFSFAFISVSFYLWKLLCLLFYPRARAFAFFVCLRWKQSFYDSSFALFMLPLL